MAVDMFLKVPDIPGESADDKHKGEIDVLSFSFGVSQAGGAPSGGGAGAGKATFSDLHVVARTQKSTPKLMLACASGQHVKEAVLVVRKAGGKPLEYLTIRMRDVRITSFELAGSQGDEGPLDQFSLGYGRIEVEYRPIDPKGTLGPAVKAGWDLKQNKKV